MSPAEAGKSLLFSASLKSAASLKAVLDLIDKDYSQEAVSLQVSNAGLQIHMIDDAQTSFLDAFFPAAKSVFTKFECHVEFLSLWVKPSFLTNALKSAPGSAKSNSAAGARVQMKVYEPADKLLLTVDPVLSLAKARSHIKHTITLLDPVAGDDARAIVDSGDFEYTVEAFTEHPAQLAEIMTHFKQAECEEIEMTLDGSALTLRSSKSKSGMNETEIELPPESASGKLCLYAEKGCRVQARFTFRHFQRVGRLCKAGCKVLLQMAEEAPLSIVCDLTDGGACQMYLAPLLESD